MFIESTNTQPDDHQACRLSFSTKDGDKLRAERGKMGLSQEDLERETGLRAAKGKKAILTRTISRIETGDTPYPHPYTVSRLADALGVEPEALLTEDKTKSQPRSASKTDELEKLREDIQIDIEECIRTLRLGRKSHEYLKKVVEERFEDWRHYAALGWPEALWLMGTCYQEGLKVVKDPVQALEFYSKAADNDFAFAMHSIGLCYASGNGVIKNKATAAKWLRKAAEQGYALAQHSLGACYSVGHGVPRDQFEAVKWCLKAAEQGVPEAQFSIGLCYYKGVGVPKNISKAVEWFHKAARQGHANAKAMLDSLDK
jgi:TPR repeat protein